MEKRDSIPSGRQVYLFHGDDLFSMQRAVAQTLQWLREDPSMAEMNLTRLDGRQADEEDLRTALNSLPFFMAERRLVILTNLPMQRYINETNRNRFLDMLNHMPSSTSLVLVIEDSIERKQWRVIKPDHWLMKWVKNNSEKAFIGTFPLPDMRAMHAWIQTEVRSQGGQIDPKAIQTLYAHVGNQTQVAALEIEKLLTYVNWKRPIEAEDVQELVAVGGKVDVFAMVDALAMGEAGKALYLLHRLMEDEDPGNLFGMIVRQFRLLLLACEAAPAIHGDPGKLADVLKCPPFVAEKIQTQARRFTLPQIEALYHRLVEIDEGVKTSQMTYEVGLDTLIASLGR
ncbi:MAG TPA: DNA polymerase III subunit delta [Anaerolineaceae bacterium]